LSRPEFLSLVRYRVNQMLDAGFNRYLVQVFRDLSTEPPVDAIGGGVDLFIVLREAGIAKFGHRRLPFLSDNRLGAPIEQDLRKYTRTPSLRLWYCRLRVPEFDEFSLRKKTFTEPCWAAHRHTDR
jgi:hypothetical protein